MSASRSAAPSIDQLLVVTNNRHRVFQSSIITGASQVAQAKGLGVAILEAPERAQGQMLLSRLKESPAAVLLIADVLPDAAVADLSASGAPITLVSHRVPGLSVPSIMHDNQQGVGLLCAHLFDDCQRTAPVFVCGSSKQQDAAQRQTAFRRELMRRGLDVAASRFLPGEFEPDQAAQELGRFLDSGGELDSLLAADYLMAISCLGVLTERGLRVPEDIAVLGFGDGPEAQSAGLTTVAADVVELGRRSARQLLGQVEGLSMSGLTLLSTALVQRKSSVAQNLSASVEHSRYH